MPLKVKFYPRMKDAVGTEVVELDKAPRTVGELINVLSERFGEELGRL